VADLNRQHRREDLSDKAQKTMTPDSQKSGLDKAKESVTDAGDKVAGTVQPGRASFSSISLRAADKVR